MNRADAIKAIDSMVQYNHPYCKLSDIPSKVIEAIIADLLPLHAIYGEGKQSMWRQHILPICPISRPINAQKAEK